MCRDNACNIFAMNEKKDVPKEDKFKCLDNIKSKWLNQPSEREL